MTMYNPPYKILFVAPVPTLKGGAETVLLDMLKNPAVAPVVTVPAEGELAATVRAMGLPVEIVPFGRVDSIKRPFTPQKALGALGDALKAAWRLRTLSRRHGVLALHSNGLKAHMLAAFARLLGGAPVVVHIHDIPLTRPEKLVWQFLRVVARRVICVSAPCWPAPALPRNTLIVPNALDPARLPAGHTLPPPPRTLAPQTPLRLGFVGRLHPFKGLDTLLPWLAEARRHGLPLTLAIRGTGEDAYVQHLTTLCQALNLTDAVTFEGRQEGFAALYGGIDVLVVPSTTPEPFGLVVIEAMAMGVPVIAYPAGALPTLIRHGETGFLAADAAAFEAAVRALAEPGLWQRTQTAAAAEVDAHYMLPRVWGELARIYKGIG